MSKPKILFIENDKELLKVVNEELKEVGFEVLEVDNGKEGIKLVQSKKPDLVFLDLLTPSEGSFEVLEELKKSPITKDIPVITLTMLGSDEDIKRGIKLGANDYIIKSQHVVSEILDKVKKSQKN
ncbi:response regulator [bacterium]|jgi:DNA-binding response OmpR family regulator|nr:response regulator [bacterium]MBT3730076.1 response regulator [bacterium]MBT4894640.1 response regulator [bacterium]